MFQYCFNITNSGTLLCHTSNVWYCSSHIFFPLLPLKAKPENSSKTPRKFKFCGLSATKSVTCLRIAHPWFSIGRVRIQIYSLSCHSFRDHTQGKIAFILWTTFSFAEMVPNDIQSELKHLYVAVGELLRHFWSCFPVNTPFLEEKVRTDSKHSQLL